MEIFKATITFFRKPPEATSVHDRYFTQAEYAIKTFENIVALEFGSSVSVIAKTEEVYDKRIVVKNGTKIAEMRVLKIPLYEAARVNLDF